MWILVDDVAVLERAWLGFIGITDQIHRPLFVRFDEAPFQPARKTGAAAATQPRVLDFVDNLGTRHRQGLFQLFVTAGAQITVDVCSPIVASEVLKNQSVLQWMRRCLPRSGGLQSAASGWADWRPPFLEICNKLRDGIGANVFVQ